MNKVSLTVLDAYDSSLNTKGINYLKAFHLVAIDFADEFRQSFNAIYRRRWCFIHLMKLIVDILLKKHLI